MASELTTTERSTLRECERVIERGQAEFIAVGQALATIKADRLYRQTHRTFDAYCRERWGFSKTQANRLVHASEVVAEMAPIGTKPANEAQARELARVPPEQREQTWQEYSESTDKPTAAGLREHIERKAEPEPEPEFPAELYATPPEPEANPDDELREWLLDWRERWTLAADVAAARVESAALWLRKQ